MKTETISPKISLCLFFLAVSFLFCGAVYADDSYADLKELYDRQSKIDNEIKSAQQNLNEAAKKEKNLTSELYAINTKIEKTSDIIEKTRIDLVGTTEKIRDIENAISVTEESLAERRDILGERLKQIYIQGRISPLQVVLQSSSITDLLTRMEYLTKIAENDQKLYVALAKDYDTLGEQKDQLDNQRTRLISIRETQEQQKNSLQLTSSQRKNLISQVQSEKEVYADMLAELENESSLITGELSRLQIASGIRPTTLSWPTPGYTSISSPYGWRIHPILKDRRFHSGVDIPAPYGYKIRAVAPGTVLSAGYRNAYGYTIILDNGGGMSTLYAHMSKFLVSAGDTVDLNQPIGQIGTSGWSTGPHLHIEVRINGETENPLNYLQK